MYKRTATGVMRLSDGAHLAADMRNPGWREYQAWLAAGNTPEPEFTLDEAKERALARIQRARDAAMDAGFEFQGYVYHSDKDAIRDVQMALSGAQMAIADGEPIPDSIGWKLKVIEGGVTHTSLNLLQLGALFKALTTNMQIIYEREADRMAEILAATTVAEADGVQW